MENDLHPLISQQTMTTNFKCICTHKYNRMTITPPLYHEYDMILPIDGNLVNLIYHYIFFEENERIGNKISLKALRKWLEPQIDIHFQYSKALIKQITLGFIS